jgi:hypothetical protein
MKVDIGNIEQEIEIRELPEDFIEWQSTSRIETLQSILEGKFTGNFGPHLPALSTKSKEGEFPVNSCYKGVGLIPEQEYLEDIIDKFEQAIDMYKDDWDNTLKERLNLLVEFYSDADKIDKTRMGSIEIYGKRTYQNILTDPRVNLLFLDIQKGSLSYMIEAVAEIYEPGTEYYRLERAFHDIFHKPSDDDRFPAVYIFNVSRVYNKTPGARAGDRIV